MANIRVLVPRAIAKLKRVIGAQTFIKGGYVRQECAEAERSGVPLYDYLERGIPEDLRRFRDDVVRQLLEYVPRGGGGSWKSALARD